MSPITTASEHLGGAAIRDFQSESPLHPKARELLHTFFDQGWADPSKIHQSSARLRILINEAQEEIAQGLGCQKSELEFVGELGFGFWIALSGLLPNTDQDFIYSTIDRQVVHAFARQHSATGGRAEELRVDAEGHFTIPDATPSAPSSNQRTICWQAVNREIGVIQKAPSTKPSDYLFADMTAASPTMRLPSNWSVALWDPRRFQGPQGLAIIAISEKSRWHNPLPPIDKRRTFGSYSKPLLLATAVALTEFLKDAQRNEQTIATLHQLLRRELSQRISGIRLLADSAQTDPRYFACAIPGTIGEEVLRNLEKSGFLIDAGSACGAGALSPSHVCDAIGWAGLAHLRVTLKEDQSESDVVDLASALQSAVGKV